MQKEIGNRTIQNKDASEILAHDIPYKLGKYEIKGELGRGTCGIVYRGFDPFVRRDVAIKVGWNEAVENMNDGSSSANLDVFNEAYATGKLQHPNIVALFDAQTEKDLSYIIMEFIEGETLFEYCKSNGKRLQTKKILELIFKCCIALDFSHQAGVIHRDIKPSNIMLTKDGETKIMDFSVAEVSQNQETKSDLIVGSPNYMSPEQVKRKNIGPSSDLYSLAAVMYQLLTGKTLFQKGSVRQIFNDIINTPAPKLKDQRPDLPEALSKIIEKALDKDPINRYLNGKDMAADITAVYDNLAYAENSININEKRSALLKLPFFSYFSSQQLDEIMTVSTIIKNSNDQIICKEGGIDDSFYLLIHGQGHVMRQNKKLSTLKQGDCFGKLPKKQSSSTTTIKAANDVFVLKISSTRIDTLSKDTQLLFFKAFTENLITRLSVN